MLNPRKSHFRLEEGNLLGHIISKDCIKIDPERIKAIQKVKDSRRKKEVQSFIGQVNFLRRFIPSLAEILMNITNMLRIYREIKWTPDARADFGDIKRDLTEAPVLVSLYFSRDFLIFSYASEHTVFGVLLQKNDQNADLPMAFFSKVLRDG